MGGWHGLRIQGAYSKREANKPQDGAIGEPAARGLLQLYAMGETVVRDWASVVKEWGNIVGGNLAKNLWGNGEKHEETRGRVETLSLQYLCDVAPVSKHLSERLGTDFETARFGHSRTSP
ncbi:MAG: hypothetical protein BVN28_00215 [Nitrospira sp. ST-bin4]|nr:MAG: hypothetical protein BVN28_00215 [Nitrospira sp. ST-bin4]